MGRLKDNWKLIVGSSIITLVIIFLAVGTDKYLGSDSFCLSCHSMSYNAQELKESTHFGALGVNPTAAIATCRLSLLKGQSLT